MRENGKNVIDVLPIFTSSSIINDHNRSNSLKNKWEFCAIIRLNLTECERIIKILKEGMR